MAADPHLSTAGCSHPEAGFNFRRAFARHWRDSVRRYGLWHTVKQLAHALHRLLRELLPWRRKARFGDLDYDWEHSVDTTRSNVSFGMQLAATLAGHQYFPSEPWIFEEMMQALPPDKSSFTFIDLGSGKGRALLLAAEQGFGPILGAEFLPELHRIAETNIARFCRGSARRCSIRSFCLDARDFAFPLEPLVVYLFNPFPQDVFASVLANLQRSLDAHPRPIWMAYRFPEFEALLQQADWLEKVAGTEQWVVYKNISCPGIR